MYRTSSFAAANLHSCCFNDCYRLLADTHNCQNIRQAQCTGHIIWGSSWAKLCFHQGSKCYHLWHQQSVHTINNATRRENSSVHKWRRETCVMTSISDMRTLKVCFVATDDRSSLDFLLFRSSTNVCNVHKQPTWCLQCRQPAHLQCVSRYKWHLQSTHT